MSVRAEYARASPLALMHPMGAARRVKVIGAGCPLSLVPPVQIVAGDVDLCVFAPTLAECRDRAWLAHAVSAATALAPDGIVYLLAPRRFRAQIAWLLRAQGFVASLRVGHLPISTPDRWLVPLRSAPAKFTLSALIPSKPLRRTLVLGLMHLPGGDGLAAALLPWAGLVFQRAGARACFSWLGAPAELPRAVVRASHDQHDHAVLHVFRPKAKRPSAVVKPSLTATHHGHTIREAALMQHLAPSVARSGAMTAHATLRITEDGRPALWQTAMRGVPLALLLDRSPARLRPSLKRFTCGGAHTKLVATLLGQLCDALGIDAAVAELCFHVCWLHHAARERSASAVLDRGQFEQIVAWLALHPGHSLEIGR